MPQIIQFKIDIPNKGGAGRGIEPHGIASGGFFPRLE
jgi:hypothetical protein